MEVLPTQSSVSLRVKAGDAKHHHHVHHHHHEDGKGHDYAHLHSQLQDHVSGGVLKDLCGCVLDEMLVEEMEKAKYERMRTKIEDRKRKAAEGQKSSGARDYDLNKALLFIEGEKVKDKDQCLKKSSRCDKKRSSKKHLRTPRSKAKCDSLNAEKAEVSSDFEENASLTIQCPVEEKCVQYCASDEEETVDWTKVNLRRKKRTARAHHKVADLSHSDCHQITQRCDNEEKAWEDVCHVGFTAEEFPSLQTCGWQRRELDGEKVKVEEADEIQKEVLDESCGEMEDAGGQGDLVQQHVDGRGDCAIELGEQSTCKQLTTICLRDMFHFPGMLCFCLCDSGNVSDIPDCVQERAEQDLVPMTRIQAMLRGRVVPFGRY